MCVCVCVCVYICIHIHTHRVNPLTLSATGGMPRWQRAPSDL